MRKRIVLFLCVLALASLSVAAFATDPTPPSVPTIDYGGAAQVVLTAIGGVMNAVFPFLAAIVALFVGIRIFRRMIKAS